MVVRHMCNKPFCINPNHLTIGTHQDNMKDMAIHGSQKGENNPQNKYNEKQIETIVALIKEDRLTLREIAEKVGVKYSTVWAVANGDVWSWMSNNTHKKTNRKMKGRKYGEQKRSEIKNDINKGLTYKEIQRIHNVSAGFINSLKNELADNLANKGMDQYR